jgi:hypothetical protein
VAEATYVAADGMQVLQMECNRWCWWYGTCALFPSPFATKPRLGTGAAEKLVLLPVLSVLSAMTASATADTASEED